MNKPYELILQDWDEVAAAREVVDGFGLEDEADPAAWLAEYAYGVRFDYMNGSPGYCGRCTFSKVTMRWRSRR